MAYCDTWVGLAVMCALVSATAMPASEDAIQVRNSYKAHNDRVRNFKCIKPRPVAIPLSELNSTFDRVNGISYEPFMTILHRCEGAGCCSDINDVCKPKTTENVTLILNVTNEISGTWKYEDYSFVNHTECECGPS